MVLMALLLPQQDLAFHLGASPENIFYGQAIADRLFLLSVIQFIRERQISVSDICDNKEVALTLI